VLSIKKHDQIINLFCEREQKMKRYMMLCMLVFGIHDISGMTRAKTTEEINTEVAKRIAETKSLLETYQRMSPQLRAQLSDSFLKSIEGNIQHLEAEYRALDASHTVLRNGLQNEISKLREALNSRLSQPNESKDREMNSRGGQTGNPKPRKSCCDSIWECFSRRDVQCAGSLATGILIGRKWKKS
jgi:hypothetical protein